MTLELQKSSYKYIYEIECMRKIKNIMNRYCFGKIDIKEALELIRDLLEITGEEK